MTRLRTWSIRAALLLPLVVAAPFLPLPRGCDPRLEELAPDRYAELARFSDTRTRREIETALRLVDPEGALAPYLALQDTGLEVRLAPTDRAPAVRVGLRASPLPPGAWPRQRIALDPGHAGGAWSQIEQRHVTRDGGPPVREGDLNWATARLVERDLVASGRSVRLTRPPPPTAPFTIGSDPRFDPKREARLWLAEHRSEIPWLAPYWAWGLWREGRSLPGTMPFELYTRHDLRGRAAAADAFSADLLVSLHHDWCHDDSNGIFVFVVGSFARSELVTASQRFWALRRVLDGSLDRSARLAGNVARALMQKLDLPALSPAYVAQNFSGWLAVDPTVGVYARNLAMLRRAPGVAIVTEGPCMNEAAEYQRLQGQELELDGRRYPARVRAYADAVVEGLLSDQ
jgi:N-acetylmuramoyl-L-alanine amidase